MRNILRILKRPFGLIAVLFFVTCIGYTFAGSSSGRPEVTFYAYHGSGVTLSLIFDLDNRGILCDEPAATEILNTVSEATNPMTAFSPDGNFWTFVSEDNNKTTDSIDYGKYSYKNVGSTNEQTTIVAFRRKGPGERSVGGSINNGDIWIADDGEQKKIGQMEYKAYISPDGEKRTGLFSRILGDNSPWLIQLGDKLYKKSDKNELTQVGWAGWRKITANDGKQMVILMTKGMGGSSKWAGRYDGKLYQDK